MTRDSEIEKNALIKDLSNKLFRPCFDILRTEIESNNFSVVLFFLILKKSEFDLHINEHNNRNFLNVDDIVKDILSKKDSENNALLREVYDYYKHIIGRLNRQNVDKIFSLIDYTVGKSIESYFSEIFEEGLNSYTKLSSARDSGYYTLPQQINEFICNLANIQKNALVYNPFAGFASFEINFQKEHKYLGQETNKSAYIIGLMRIIANNKGNFSKLINEDSIENWNPWKQKFDLIVSYPPFGAKLNSSYFGHYGESKTPEGYVIERGLEDLNAKGKLIIVLSQGFLFRNNSEKRIRQYLIENDLIENVISFPAKLLSNIGIPFSVLVINKNKSNKGSVKFVDASEFILSTVNRNISILESTELLKAIEENSNPSCVREISNSKIAEEDYNLIVNRYFTAELQIEEGVIFTKLEELGKELKANRSVDGDNGLYVTIKDLKNDKTNYHLTLDTIDKIDLPTRTQIINESCLLVAAQGSNLKPTYFTYSGQSINVGLGIIAIKIDLSKIDLDYLINELHSEYITEQLSSYRIGSTIKSLSKKDLFQLKIKLLPLLVDQRNSVKSVKDALLQAKLKEIGLEDELERIRKAQKDDLSIKKHNIMQHLNNVKESADLLMQLMNKNGGTLNANTVINPNLNTNVGTRFNRMIESINDTLFFVDNLTNEIVFEKSDAFDINELLKEAIEKGINKPEVFKLDYAYDDSPFIVWDGEEGHDVTIEPVIEISKKAIFEIYNNILENAMRHGFTDNSKNYIFRIELLGSLESNKVQISFSNNGSPFPTGIAERYCIKGEKAGKTGNTGIGTWKVCEIVKHYGGSIEVLDLKGEDFPVKINITFPLKSYLAA